MKRSYTAGKMKKVLTVIQTVFYGVMNLFTFRPAGIIEFETNQRLLFEGSTCKVMWETRGAYRVKLFLNGKFYKSYKPNAMAELPVYGSFRVEIIARGIYGKARQSLAIAVNYLQFKQAEKFNLNGAVETRPKVHRSLTVFSKAMVPVTPSPELTPLLVTLENTYLIASREKLEQEIIANSYQSETNFQ